MISAEQRAKETVSDFHARLPASYAIWGKGRRDRLQAAITTAILEAENAKLEEALGTIGQGFWGTKENPHRHGSVEAIWIGMKPDEMIEAIRSLISKKEPVDLVGIGTAALERGLNSKPKD